MSDKKPDLPRLLKPLRGQGWKWEPTGKLVPAEASIVEDTPWIAQNLDFDCYLWNRIFHHTAAQEQMVHTHCHTCFKVVVAPRNFLELIELERWQERSGLRCKCGIEIRDYVARAYGGYHYSWEPGDLQIMAFRDPSVGEDGKLPVYRIVDDTEALRKGREKYEKVCKGMWDVFEKYHTNWPNAPMLVGHMPVILKRGCTEFEQHLGPTDQPRYRNISDEQVELEKLIDEHVEYEHGMFVAEQPDVIKDYIRGRWCEFAHSIGDMTYVEWLGRRLHGGPVVYHNVDEE